MSALKDDTPQFELVDDDNETNNEKGDKTEAAETTKKSNEKDREED